MEYRDLYFPSDRPFTKEEREKIASFVDGLNELGVDIHVVYNEKPQTKIYGVYFSYTMDAVERIRTRGAGRKAAACTKLIGEVKEYMQDHTIAETARWAGVSEATFYRYLKKCKSGGWWDDEDYQNQAFVF